MPAVVRKGHKFNWKMTKFLRNGTPKIVSNQIETSSAQCIDNTSSQASTQLELQSSLSSKSENSPGDNRSNRPMEAETPSGDQSVLGDADCNPLLTVGNLFKSHSGSQDTKSIEKEKRCNDRSFPLTREEEKFSIQSIMEKDKKRFGDNYYVISGKWFKEWCEYTHCDYKEMTNTIDMRNGAPRPGPINNNPLLDPLALRMETGDIEEEVHLRKSKKTGVEKNRAKAQDSISHTKPSVSSSSLSLTFDIKGTTKAHAHNSNAVVSSSFLPDSLSIPCISTLSFESQRFLKLRIGLQKTEYQLLPELAWNKLHSWYGGGPAILRKVVIYGFTNQSLHVELYPVNLLIVRKDTGNQQYLCVTPTTTIKELRKLVASLWQLPPLRCFLYLRAFNEPTIQCQDSESLCIPLRSVNDMLDSTMESLGIRDYCVVVVKVLDTRDPSFGNDNNSKNSLSQFEGEDESRQEAASVKLIPRSVKGKPIANGVSGLINLHNTCYMNASLQLLSNIPQLREYFLSSSFLANVNLIASGTNSQGQDKKKRYTLPRGDLSKKFSSLLKDLWSGEHIKVAPCDFRASMVKFSPKFSGYEQQDALEFMEYLLNGLHEDLKRRSFGESFPCESSFISDLFRGSQKQELLCNSCGNVSSNSSGHISSFFYLSLPIPLWKKRIIKILFVHFELKCISVLKVNLPENATVFDLKLQVLELGNLSSEKHTEILIYNGMQALKDEQELGDLTSSNVFVAYAAYELESFKKKNRLSNWRSRVKKFKIENDIHTIQRAIEPDIVTINNCIDSYLQPETVTWNCPNCHGRKGKALKTVGLSKMPQVLLLHIQRFCDKKEYRKKMDIPIEFPFHLEINTDLHTTRSYSLSAACVHLGNADHGHYITIAKNEENRWFKFDDDNCNEIIAEEVTNELYQQNVYILAYVSDDLSY